LLLIACTAVIAVREVAAGSARFQGFPTRQRLVIYAIPNPPAEPIVKLPQPVAPGTDKNHLATHDAGASAVVTIENTSAIEAAPKAPLEKSEADLEADARKVRIKAERERLNHNAVLWQQERAAGGSSMAQRSLAMRYFTGDGVEKDEVKGMDFLRKAAAGGDSAAKKELAKREPAKKE
jgi:hypothetical protein